VSEDRGRRNRDNAATGLVEDARPALAETLSTAPARGTVLVRTPGSMRSVALDGAAGIPVGSVVDARRGAIVLRTALPGGDVQEATVGGAKFQLRQSKSGMTSIRLRGGDFSACRSDAPAARAAAAHMARAGHPTRRGRGRSAVVRRLWARDDHGRFRTHGANSVATVRGTSWVTVDRCDGTLTIVLKGEVVVHDERTRRNVTVSAGERYLARAQR
jgi:hypothetical protein